ncbi:MAG: S8 family peptidase [Salibacteraceae bacterium]
MAKKPHIKLNSSTQKEQSIKMDFNYGFGGQEDRAEEEPDYLPMVDTFRGSLARLNTDLTNRRQERNEALQIPAHIDYIQIRFQDQFNIKDYYQFYYNEFGLEGVNFSHFNREVLFAVVDQDKFATFLQDIQNFILKESGENEQAEYRGKVKFIRDFKLLTTKDILDYQDRVQLMNFKLIEFPAGSEDVSTIYNRLQQYLTENEYEYRLIEDTGVLEVFGASQESIEEIARNFDILLSVTSSLSTVVRPSELNTVERAYGFEISNPDEDLPTIGILDTGISNTTPLAPILINDDRFNLTGSSPFVDNANDGFGHGTSIAALAALGRKPYSVNYIGEIPADARLLSVKILDADSGHLSMLDVLDLLKRAKAEYPEMRLFVLTTCYSAHKATNEDFSAYAYELDKFAHENDCLIFICTANNNNAINQTRYDLNYFKEEETNLSSPADSMNNVVVGAAADNLQDGTFAGISHGREFPTLYSRKSHIDLEQYKKPDKRFTKNNPHLFKPDVIEGGGDYEQGNGFVGTNNDALMEVLSANPAFGFYRHAGTSFSTPLVANIAAQIQKSYPTLRVQTIKALIVNSASLDAIPFADPVVKLRNKTAGYGVVNPDKSTTSTDNAITFVIEDEINPDEMKIIPLNFPAYLIQEDLGKKGVLKLSATLCFSFEPVQNNQLGYCPLRMAFRIVRNQSAEDILKSEKEVKSHLKESWSQNNRGVSNPIPASNTQKVNFQINTKDLEEEGSTFKLVIHCLLNPQLLPQSLEKYNKAHPLSMAITLEENLTEAKQTGKLYAEMLAVNEIENIIHVEGEAEAEGDV